MFADEELARHVASLTGGPAAREVGAAALRAASAERTAARPRGPELAAVEDVVLAGGLVVRVYGSGPGPALVFLHGGGWTIGDLESHDRLCRRLSLAAGLTVVAVDYRRAPESSWPAAVLDALAAFRWARERWDVVAVGGDSAGGNLAALACLFLRDAGEAQPALQVLVYPNTDLTFSQPSVREKATGWGLDADDARWFAEQWVPDPVLRADPRVSPLLEPDLSGLAPALVVTAEHDPLRDEGDGYAEALAAAGVPVVHRTEPGLVHGFLGLDLVSPAAARACEQLFADVARLLRT